MVLNQILLLTHLLSYVDLLIIFRHFYLNGCIIWLLSLSETYCVIDNI